MKLSIKILFSLVLIFFLIAPLVAVRAADDEFGLDVTAKGAGITTADKITKKENLQTKIGTVTGAVLSLVGVAFFLLTLYGGFLWMTARGDDAQAKRAMGVIIDAGIGLVIVSAAYIITNFVFGAIK